MKPYLILLLVSICPLLIQAQTSDSTNTFGVTINSSLNGELYPVRLIPSLTYTRGKSQFELGIGIHPFIRKDQKIVSGEFNYKFFPNGIDHKFNMYLVSCFSFIHNARETYYPTTYNYLFLNGGYGFDINAFGNFYLGTNISAGIFTYSKKSEIPYDSFASKQLFDDFGFNLAFQFNIGYRF